MKEGYPCAKKRSTSPIFWAVLAIPVLYLAALLASGYEDGMTAFDLLGRFNVLLERPFSIRWTPHTLKFMLAAMLLYGFALTLFLSTRENLRLGEEHGSAKWGNVRQLCAKYRDKDPFQNTLLTQNLRMGLNGKKAPPQPPANRHRRLRRRQDPLFLQAEPDAGKLFFSGHGPQGRNAPGRGPSADPKGLCHQGV